MNCTKCNTGHGEDGELCPACEKTRRARERRRLADIERRAIVEQVIGNACVHCSGTENLRITSSDPQYSSKDMRRNQERFEKFLQNAQAVCLSCLNKQAASGRRVGHGEGRQGVKKCSCDLCAPLKRQRRRERETVSQLYRKLFDKPV